MSTTCSRCFRWMSSKSLLTPLCLPLPFCASARVAAFRPERPHAVAGRRCINLSSTDFDPVGLAKDGPKPERDAVRIEVLKLYRMFTWKDYDGVEFRTKIIQSTRKEFEQARDEKDPEIIAQLIVGGNEAIERVLDRLEARAMEIAERDMNQAMSLHHDEFNAPRGGQRKGRGPPGDKSKWLSHEDMMKKEFMYRHQNWENRRNLEGDAWRKQFEADQASSGLVGGPPTPPPPKKRLGRDQKIELKWRTKS